MQRRALLAGAATAATAALAGCAGGLFENRVQETRNHEFALPTETPVRVTTVSGDIGLETADRTNVAVDVRVNAPNEDRLEDVSVETSTVEGALAVEVDVTGATSSVGVNLDAEVPEGTAIGVVESRNGDVAVRDVASVEAARSSNGDISVRDAGPVESVTTENGDVGADVPAPLVGDVLLRTENGDVDAAVSSDVDAAVDAHTASGDVSVSGLDLADADVAETRLTGTLGAGSHDLTAATTNGDVDLQSLEE